jgi:hypothetical protein
MMDLSPVLSGALILVRIPAASFGLDKLNRHFNHLRFLLWAVVSRILNQEHRYYGRARSTLRKTTEKNEITTKIMIHHKHGYRPAPGEGISHRVCSPAVQGGCRVRFIVLWIDYPPVI